MVVAIDDSEQAYLKVLCDEIFGRNNFIASVIIQSNPRGRTTNTHFATCHEYAIFYAKDIDCVSINFLKLTKSQQQEFDKNDENGEYRLLPFRRSGGTSTPEERPNSYYPIYYNPIKNLFSLENSAGFVEIFPIDKYGKKRVWRQTRPSLLEAIKRGDMVCNKSKGKYVVQMKDRSKGGRKPKTIWADSKYDASANGTVLLKNIFEGDKVFSYPKSLFTVKDIVDIITERGGDDIVLDIFGGSGTTAHAVMLLNKEDGGKRKFVLSEQMDYAKDVTAKRMYKVIKNEHFNENFVYCELLNHGEDAMKEIQGAKNAAQLYAIWIKMCNKYYLNYNVEIKRFNENKDDLMKLEIKYLKKIMFEMINKNQLYVNLSEIDDEQYNVSNADKLLNKLFYKGTIIE